MDQELTADNLKQATSARPAVVSAAQPEALALSRPPGPLPNPTPLAQGGRILVADDDPRHRELLLRRLHQQGFSVEEAENGPQALRLLREREFDLLLLDMIMPPLNGDQVLAQIKADPSLRHVPVIMLSALDEMDSVVRCILMGAEDYLAKPFNTVLLRARIGACLEKRRLRQQEEAYLSALETERQRSESLLLNVLPRPIADRLKRGETTIVDSLPAVTVLFADLAGFTTLSTQVSSVELVRLLDDIFSAFDGLAEAQGLEKIKTIGDAYMVVGGLPTPRPDHAEAVAEVALNMLAHIEKAYASLRTPIRIRIGVNTGPVIAGIIGRHKFNYDLWGDTVNIASRMESHSLPGRIQVTAATHALLEAKYVFEPRGVIEVKGKGRLKTWFLQGRK
jgi:class 3 adenylate cyclase